MQTCFDTLTPLARAAVPDHSMPFSPALVLWEDTLPGGAHWSGVLRRGTTLRLTDLEGRANVSALFFNQEEKTERYNMPDTLKAQHTAHLTRGHALYSDMGRVLCSIPDDSCGWHDTVCGVMDAATSRQRFGEANYQQHRNAMQRNGHDGFVVELGFTETVTVVLAIPPLPLIVITVSGLSQSSPLTMVMTEPGGRRPNPRTK